mmetsp:Transcript_42184/g.76097  ORF Transcript_42184/g.76097 Transcript_42184/m.76097 type:complete len:601 (-) Transcript_42184:44-1846(-)
MPPTKKRNRNLGSSDSSDHFSKATRSDGGRRGLTSTGGDGGPAFVLGSSSPATSTRQVSSSATRGRLARERKYLDAMAKLNYQIYQWATRQLESGSIPCDEFYFGAVENYLRHASDISGRFNRSYGDIVVFGDGDCGQLGCGEAVTEARKPKILINLRGKKIITVSSGGLHSLALVDDGTVYSWGCNDEGSLGWLATEEKDDGALPSEIKGFYPSQYGPNGTDDLLDNNGQIIPFVQRNEAFITQVATGETQSLALSTEGDVFMWGAYKDNEGRKFRSMPPKDDKRKATGHKDMANLEEDDRPEWFEPPRGNQDWPMHLVEMPKKATAIYAGGSFSAALLVDGTIVTFGVGICGELARPVPELSKKTSNEVVLGDYLKPKPPVWEQPRLKQTVVTMACGGYHFLVGTRGQDGLSVFSSGLNQYGQLGHGDTKHREKLTKIQHLEGLDITKVEGGDHFSCFIDKTGKNLYTCGRGDYGQLGISLEQPDPGYLENLPLRVPLVYEPKGAVSNPKENSIKTEDIVEEDQPEIEQISCGSTHVLVLTKGGDAYSWGFGGQGACGQGSSDEDVLRPKKLVMKKCKMQYVSGGGQHSTAIVTTGSV